MVETPRLRDYRISDSTASYWLGICMPYPSCHLPSPSTIHIDPLCPQQRGRQTGKAARLWFVSMANSTQRQRQPLSAAIERAWESV